MSSFQRPWTRSAFAAAMVAGVALGSPAGASAGTVGSSGGKVVLAAASGEANDVTVNFGPDRLVVHDAGAVLRPGAGCERAGEAVACPDPADGHRLNVELRLGDRADRAHADDLDGDPRSLVVLAGTGDDRVHVGTVDGLRAVTYGGSGDDELSSSMNYSPRATHHGDAGDDVITLAEAFGGKAYGGVDDDDLRWAGTIDDPALLTLDAGAGDDVIRSGDYEAWMYRVAAGTGTDTLDAASGEGFAFDLAGCPRCAVERIVGSASDDTILGDATATLIEGGDGNDVIDPRGGRDTVAAGAGADTIRARDGRRDTIGCGADEDGAVVDRDEAVAADCEAVEAS